MENFMDAQSDSGLVLTDEEVICTRMDPGREEGEWWVEKNFAPCFGNSHTICPQALTLDRLHEVEKQLTEEQWWAYELELSRVVRHMGSTALGFIHASAAQKIKAQAIVLRG
jgi:hypothetical protein